MKNFKYIIFTFLLMLLFLTNVKAKPSYTFYTSTNSVENGKSVTATVVVKNAAMATVKINSAGNTNGCSNSELLESANSKDTTLTYSVTCKATSIGSISFSLTGEAISSDESFIKLNSSVRVNVVQPRPLSQNNYLASITVDKYDLKPVFNEEVYEYTVSVPNTVNEINISSKVKDNYASVSGNGTFEVSEGSNVFKLVVTAENGSTREYSVNVVVEDLNPIEIMADGIKYTIVKNVKTIETPELFKESTIKVNDIEVPAYTSDVTEFVLLPVKDENGNVNFVIINDDNSYSIYRTIKIGNVLFYFMNDSSMFDDFETSELEFADFKIKALHSTLNTDYYLIYGKNMSSGTIGWYKYDSKESTLQRYENAVELKLKDVIKDYFLVIVIFGAGLFLAIVIAIVAIIISSKKSKKVKIDYQIKLKDLEIKEIQNKNEKHDKKKKEKVKSELDSTKEFDKSLLLESENSSLLSDTVKIDKEDLSKLDKKGSKKK